MHLALQQRFQIALAARLLEQAPLLLHLHQHVEVTAGPHLAAGDRSEYPPGERQTGLEPATFGLGMLPSGRGCTCK
jgi:hypothetical protein